MLEVNSIDDGTLLGNISMGPDGGIIATSGLAQALVRGWRLHGFEDRTIYEQLLPGFSNGYYEVVPGMPDPEPEPAAAELGKADEGAVGKYKARNLIKWFKEGADGQIAWGTPGDFEECSRLAIEHGHMTPEQAHGFCNLRHRDATGAAPGHAAGEKALHKADGTDRDTADAVYQQLAEDYPPDSIAWVRAAKWSGPTQVPLDKIDFSNSDSWRAAHEPDKVHKTVRKLAKGKSVKPIVLVDEPNKDKMIVADGHHRAMGYQQAGQDAVAYVASVGAVKGPWDVMHASQRVDPSSEK